MAISRQYKDPLEEKMEQAKERKRGQGMLIKDTQGRLVEAQPQSGQQAANLLGQQAPTTPLGVAQMGMGPDVAKMAGTPTQVESAMRQQAEPQQEISTARRQQQARQTATGEEQEVLEKSAHLQALGSLGDQVHNLISGEFSALKSQQIQAGTDLPLPDQVSQALNLPEGPEKQAAVNEALAGWANEKLASGQKVNFGELMSMFPSAQDAIASMAQAGLEDTLEVDNSLLMGLGYPSMEHFTETTGIQVPEGTTLSEFQDLIQQSIDQEFAETSRLQSIMNDPSASASDRAAARQQLIDIGAVGLRGAEQAAHEIEQAVSEADDIIIGGESVSLEEALSDEYLSNVVARAIDDPEFLSKLQEENPGFASFIVQNQELLSDLAQDIEVGEKTLQKVKEDQRKAVQIEGLGAFSDDALTALGIDLEKYGTEVKGLPDNSFVQLLQDEGLPPEQRNRLMTSINDIASKDPEFLQSIGELSPEDIEDLGGLEEGSMIQTYADYLKNPNRAADDVKYALEGVTSAADLFEAEKRLAEHNLSTALGKEPDGKLSPMDKYFQGKYQDFFSDDGALTEDEISQIPLEDLVKLGKVAIGNAQTPIKEALTAGASNELAQIDLSEIPSSKEATLEDKETVTSTLDELLAIRNQYGGDAFIGEDLKKNIRDLSSILNTINKIKPESKREIRRKEITSRLKELDAAQKGSIEGTGRANLAVKAEIEQLVKELEGL